MPEQLSARPASRVRASELTGRAWLNTGGQSLDLQKLRGKIVLLDFWTFCCINCLHVLDELRPLEEQYADVLVTVGVHSPKFEHEADPEALAAAVERYEIRHPVLDDPELATWQAYSARAWPTLVVIDPEGYIVAHLSGEGHAAGLASLIPELIAEHEAQGTLHRGDGPYIAPEPRSGTLRFPGKVLPLPAAQGEPVSFLVSDTGHHRLVELAGDLQTVLRTIGAGPESESGQRGFADGPAAEARFNEPHGLALLPRDVAEQTGYDVVVADAVNHRLRGLSLETGQVTTLAGNGVQRLLDAGPARVNAEGGAALGGLPGEPREISLSSPWDVVYSEQLGQVVIAMAGTHQIFGFDPLSRKLSILAGTGLEGVLDGAPDQAWFAQPSGLAVDAQGDIWVADSETSALRVLRVQDGELSAVETVIGEGLFDFGFRDGPSEQARLQHPLGAAVLPDGSVAIADTYNGAVRRYDPVQRTVSTLARGLAEPSDVLLDGKHLLVVEANRHQLTRIPVPSEALAVDEGAAQMQRPRTDLAPGDLQLTVRFAAPSGQKLDHRWGDPTQLKISATPPELLSAGSGTAQGLNRTLVLNGDVTEGVLHITARAAACDGEPDGEIPEYAACHMYQQDWGIPVRLVGTGDRELALDLRGMH